MCHVTTWPATERRRRDLHYQPLDRSACPALTIAEAWPSGLQTVRKGLSQNAAQGWAQPWGCVQESCAGIHVAGVRPYAGVHACVTCMGMLVKHSPPLVTRRHSADSQLDGLWGAARVSCQLLLCGCVWCRLTVSAAAAGQASVVRDDGGKLGRPIPPKAISDCVHAWLKQHEATVGPWAYDGRNNLYATKTLVDSKQINKEKYQEFTVELPNEGRKFPSRFQCAPPPPPACAPRVTQEHFLLGCPPAPALPRYSASLRGPP